MAECTIYDKLRYIAETKDLIKMAIESQDVEVLESATFRQYAEYITEIRKVSSINGMQGDVVLTIGDLGGYTKEEIDNLLKDVDVDLSDYYTKNDIDSKGYITAIPDEYITEDELSSELKDKVSETALNEALKGYYDKGEVDNLINNVDVTEQLQNYYTKEEIEGKKYLTEEELSETLDIITALGEDIANLEENKQDKLTQGTGIKIEENVISVDYSYDLVEVVDQLPIENINENKLYLIQEVFPQSYQIEGGMSERDVEYTEECPNVYAQTTEVEVDGNTGQILSKYRSRVTFSGYDTFTMGIGLDNVYVMGYQTQLYIAVGNVNEDLSNGLNDFTTAKAYVQGLAEGDFTGIRWTNVTYSNLNPSNTYFIDIWSNGGEEKQILGVAAYSYIALPNKTSTSLNKFDEYIYVNNQWEKVGEVTPEVDLNNYYTKSEVDYLISTVEGGGGEGVVGNIIEVTQDEYDAITPEEDALYIITDAPEVTIPTKLSELEQDIEIGKTYTSGTGIKIEGDTISLNTNATVDSSSNYFALWGLNNNGRTTILQVKGSDSIQIAYDDNRTYPTLYVSDKVALKTDIPDLSTKQDVLVSGINIKTINGEDILGEGNITIEGGGGNANVIELTQAEYDALTEYEEAFYLITDASSGGGDYYTKDEIDALIGGVENKITEINNLI